MTYFQALSNASKKVQTNYCEGFGYILFQFMGHLHGKYFIIFTPDYENFLLIASNCLLIIYSYRELHVIKVLSIENYLLKR